MTISRDAYRALLDYAMAELDALQKDKARLDGLIDIIKHNTVSLSYSFNGFVNAQYGCGACFTGHTDFRKCLDAMIAREQGVIASRYDH